MKKQNKKPKIIRPEIKGPAINAAIRLAKDRSNQIHEMSYTELINYLLLEEWQRKYPGMKFPDDDGNIVKE